MMGPKRFWLLLLATLIVVGTVLLAAGVPRMELLPGQFYALGEGLSFESGMPALGTGSAWVEIFFRAGLVIAALLLPFGIVYFLVSPKARKQIIRQALVLLLFFAFYYMVLSAQLGEVLNNVTTNEIQSPNLTTDSAPSELPPPPEFVADSPPWLVFVATLGVAILITAIVGGGIWLLMNRRRPAPTPLEQLAQEADSALKVIRSGGDLRNTVLRCYAEMSRVLREQRGIERKEAMTPREFEQYLAETGIPAPYVRQLTRLFEDVRYGSKSLGEQEERQAVLCLTAIVDTCRNPL